MDESDVKEYLIQNDKAFRQLVYQHQDYEQKLRELNSKRYPSVQDQFQETVIKKRKLALKDRMQLRIHLYQSENSV